MAKYHPFNYNSLFVLYHVDQCLSMTFDRHSEDITIHL